MMDVQNKKKNSVPESQQPFFIFGQGDRCKLLYKQGTLVNLHTGTELFQVDAASETINASDYSVIVLSTTGEYIRISEDEYGIFLDRNDHRVSLSESPVSLPTFQDHTYAHLLRILHHEILINIVDGRPVPNFLVYAKPWYRDAAMMAMVLETTGNIQLLQDWIINLDDPFDRNNAGHEEPDNLGQLLYLISLSDNPTSHPLIARILEQARQVAQDGHLTGVTDGRQHPIYQTKWMKYGLHRLGLVDDYVVPDTVDVYAGLCWWDKTDIHLPDTGNMANNQRYPYLSWAEANFLNAPPPLHLAGSTFPLTWEAHASQADYEGMRIIDPQYTRDRICYPHTWHAAEMFLYLFELG